MAYQTGTAATPDQLLDALRVFAVANGWTQLHWAPSGTGQALSLGPAIEMRYHPKLSRGVLG